MRRAIRLSLERPSARARPNGRVFVVTGAAFGIGHAVARQLARAGAHVVLLVRDESSVREARAAVAGAPGDERVEAHSMDLSDPGSIRAVADVVLERNPEIHGLLHCAGLLLPRRELGPAGFERMFAVELLGPFLLTRRLLEGLRRAEASRIVFSTSDTRFPVPGASRRLEPANLQAEAGFRPLAHARHLALARILLARELGERLRPAGVGTLVVRPTAARTGYLDRVPAHLRVLARALVVPGWPGPPETAASEIVHAAAHPDLTGASGQYLVGTRETVPPPAARSPRAQRHLWDVLENLAGEGHAGDRNGEEEPDGGAAES